MPIAAKKKPRKKLTKPKKQLAAEAAPANPGDRGIALLTVSTRQAGGYVTEDTALTLGAVWGCVRVISEGLACLPWQVFERRADGGRTRKDDDPADWLLSTQANPETPAFQFRET